MSLFASLEHGNIWALSGLSFARYIKFNIYNHHLLSLFILLFSSPINDLLDSGNFTLENLLCEDELIQEVKAKNDRLITL